MHAARRTSQPKPDETNRPGQGDRARELIGEKGHPSAGCNLKQAASRSITWCALSHTSIKRPREDGSRSQWGGDDAATSDLSHQSPTSPRGDTLLEAERTVHIRQRCQLLHTIASACSSTPGGEMPSAITQSYCATSPVRVAVEKQSETPSWSNIGALCSLSPTSFGAQRHSWCGEQHV